MEEQDVLLHFWLSGAFSFGSVMPSKILGYYGGCVSKFYYNLEEEVKKFKISEKSLEKLKKRNLKSCEEILNLCKKYNFKIITYNEEKYPERLRQIKSAPIVLYYVGNLDATFNPCVSVVGTRDCDEIGEQNAKDLSIKLSNFGITTISGCAKGIDGIIHKETIRAGGKTVAVLGTCLESSYPFENKELKKEIIKNNGLILSEYPPKTETKTWHFPIRNRIISALSDCVVVVQSKEKSGTLLTAQKALEFNKKLFCIPPSNIFNERSQGVKICLKKGASLLTGIEDILNVFKNSKYKITEKTNENNDKINKKPKLPEKFAKLVKIIGKEKRLDEILRQANSKTAETLFILTQMELLNIVEKTKTGYKKC